MVNPVVLNLRRLKANLAQLVEQHPRNVQVASSILVVGSLFCRNMIIDHFGYIGHRLYHFLFICRFEF